MVCVLIVEQISAQIQQGLYFDEWAQNVFIWFEKSYVFQVPLSTFV